MIKCTSYTQENIASHVMIETENQSSFTKKLSIRMKEFQTVILQIEEDIKGSNGSLRLMLIDFDVKILQNKIILDDIR